MEPWVFRIIEIDLIALLGSNRNVLKLNVSIYYPVHCVQFLIAELDSLFSSFRRELFVPSHISILCVAQEVCGLCEMKLYVLSSRPSLFKNGRHFISLYNMNVQYLAENYEK